MWPTRLTIWWQTGVTNWGDQLWWPTGLTNWGDQLGWPTRVTKCWPTGLNNWVDQLDWQTGVTKGWPTGLTNWVDQLVWPTGMTNWGDQLGWPIGVTILGDQLGWPMGDQGMTKVGQEGRLVTNVCTLVKRFVRFAESRQSRVCSILKPKSVLSKGIRISTIYIRYWHYPPSYRVFDRWNLNSFAVLKLSFFSKQVQSKSKVMIQSFNDIKLKIYIFFLSWS